jgi:hypothetical protein
LFKKSNAAFLLESSAMNLKKALKMLKQQIAQSSLEYLILFCVIAMLTIVSLNPDFLNRVREILQGQDPVYPGFFRRAVDKMLLRS